MTNRASLFSMTSTHDQSRSRFGSPLVRALLVTAIAIVSLSAPMIARAAWYSGGVLVSNVCRAPSGAWWIYPPANAQPVGTYCTIPPTGEVGLVTPN